MAAVLKKVGCAEFRKSLVALRLSSSKLRQEQLFEDRSFICEAQPAFITSRDVASQTKRVLYGPRCALPHAVKKGMLTSAVHSNRNRNAAGCVGGRLVSLRLAPRDSCTRSKAERLRSDCANAYPSSVWAKASTAP